MILVTRLNGSELVLNAELIQWIEHAPDTIVTLVTGEKIVLVEAPGELVSRIIEYRCAIGGAARATAVLAARAAVEREQAEEQASWTS